MVTGAAVMALAGAAAPAGAGLDEPARAANAAAVRPLRAVVSIPPLQGLVEPIVRAANGDAGRDGGRATGVQSLIPPGASEHGYELPPSKLNALAEAEVVVLVGMGLEPQIEKFLKTAASPSGGRVVVRFADVAGIEAGEGHGHDHDHAHAHGEGEACEHDHGAGDPHLWLDPVMAERLVNAVTDAVAGAVKDDSARKERVIAAGKGVAARVREVHSKYAVEVGQFGDKTIVVGHDAWGWLAKRYGLTTVAIAGLNANEPTPKALERAAGAVREHGLRVVFAEPQLGDRAVRRIASATGAEVRTLDPLGDGDWFKMMEQNLAALKGALGDRSKPGTAAK